ncbi:MAG TPA: carbamoyltransferase HypF [Leptolyngbyaceae cyanobacterium M33_DOE_097]|uniref:Carbamoyltransferase n=1 Tax=Oscillatoriales cyanobacterium SpSt-418 TaxID=2282169 RepID=A0A7C3KGN6_9CYAN|nr:carbamoyltransferase HypF [Leptolyngbyaceae cyanobacterium M33_DOE_097]
MTVNDTQIDPSTISQQRLQIIIRGIVQGIGFRPFIYRLATELDLVGWVNNSSQGVVIDVEGARSHLDLFLQRLERDKPARSLIQQVELSILNPVGYSTFEIRASADGEKTTSVLADLSICSECLQEIFDPANRRYRYPFTNCTHCGPRFSLTEALPYDRCHTTMRHFTMCQQCQSEYEDPLNRRFHAQSNACPHCGPHLELWNQQGYVLSAHDQALQMAAASIRQGHIVGIKGLGGFHLMVDARNEAGVQRLRLAKYRPVKPFALMYPSLERVKADCEVSDLEAQILQASEAPIVLLKQFKLQSPNSEIAPSVTPNNPYLGIMLPYTPLHHLLMNDLGFPVVATSGNLSDEPICIDEYDAIQRLGQVADVFLVHNRPIAQAIDDSVVRVFSGQETVLRRARGYAPLPTSIGSKFKTQNSKLTVLAVGAHLKNTIAFSIDQQAFISQHIGDLETVAAVEALHRAIAHFQTLYDLQLTAIACDLHPDYRSTQLAEQLAKQLKIPIIPVQHHYAHVLSCMAEHQLEGTALGIAWDGTGYGLDGTIWGGEFLRVTDTSFQRVAHLRPFRLPGADKAIREPRRSAVGLLYELLDNAVFENAGGDDYSLLPAIQAFSSSELQILKTMLNKNLNTPITSSMGRLFDAIAAMTGVRQQNQFEGQAAMELESAIAGIQIDNYYPFKILNFTHTAASMLVDWTEMMQSMLLDIKAGVSVNQISAMFHNTLVEMIVAVAKQVEERRVILTGGCFQNKYLLERAIQRLRIEGFQPYCHCTIPSNDGGIAMGQLIAAFRQLTGGKSKCV